LERAVDRLRQIFFSVVVTVFLGACGGSESPTDPIGDGDGNNNGNGSVTRTIKASPSFAADIQEIFTRIGCTASGCHGGSAGGLTLGSNASTNHASLVGVQSSVGDVYVIENDAVNSYLVKKLEGTGSGSRMPIGGSALGNIDLTNIKNWINSGAANN
jgi:hypothetical protein